MESVIKVTDVKKKFRLYYDRGGSFKERLIFKNQNRYEDRWVLNGISVEVEKGETLGLIGHNGCGKSTLLKLLTGIYYPDSGRIQMNGRVSSLIELGAGFHPDMSGRENIYTNASIFGLKKHEIDERLEDIIRFSELEEFIDNPVRTYSSGMYMRLAFAVAINVDADILLIDEILAVGDVNFQAKCFEHLRGLKAAGVTIVLVTHDMETVKKFCNKVLWINDGEAVAYGSSVDVVNKYSAYMNGKRIEQLKAEEEFRRKKEEEEFELYQKKSAHLRAQGESLATNPAAPTPGVDYTANRYGLRYIEIEEACLLNHEGEKTTVLEGGKPCEILIYYKVNKPLEEYVFGMGINTLEKYCLMGNNTQLDQIKVPHTKMNGCIRFKIRNLPMLSGRYGLNVSIEDANGAPMDYYQEYMQFDVITNDWSIGSIMLDHEWVIDG